MQLPRQRLSERLGVGVGGDAGRAEGDEQRVAGWRPRAAKQ